MRMPGHPSRGFTLLEMLVALAVFAVLGLMSSQMLSRILVVHEVATTRGQRLSEIQRGMDLLQRDIMQLVHRPVRDELGDSIPALRVGGEPPLELTRTGWRNPLWLPRSELQRVAYLVDADDRLVRYYWGVLDRAEDTEPVVQVLIEDVGALEVAVLDRGGNEQSFWPLIGDEGVDPDRAIVGIQVRIDVAPFGEITRIWDVPAPFVERRGTGPGSSDSNADEAPPATPRNAPELARRPRAAQALE